MHKFTLLLKKESRSIIAFAILSAILVTLLLLDFDKNLFSEIFHDILSLIHISEPTRH